MITREKNNEKLALLKKRNWMQKRQSNLAKVKEARQKNRAVRAQVWSWLRKIKCGSLRDLC
jgi:hypothetical protein